MHSLSVRKILPGSFFSLIITAVADKLKISRELLILKFSLEGVSSRFFGVPTDLGIWLNLSLYYY